MTDMKATLELLERLPDAARDARINVSSVLQQDSLPLGRRWGVAVASAAAARNPELLAAVLSDARREAGDAVVDDGIAAASLMAMNNVYYRFRHMVGKETYSQKPARLRMQRLAKPSTTKGDLELFSLAASAIGGCEACVVAHERAVLEAGLTEDDVHDAVRIAAVIHAAAASLGMVGVAEVATAA